MKEIREIVYESVDGVRFLSRTNCEKHENQLNKTKALLAHIREYCQEMCEEKCNNYYGCNMCTNCQCPFYDEKNECNCYFDCLPRYGL